MHSSYPFVGAPEQVVEPAGLELRRAPDGLFPVSGGSVEEDCFEI